MSEVIDRGATDEEDQDLSDVETPLNNTLLSGLNLAVSFSEGHSWTGIWLTKRDFGQVTEPVVEPLRKAIDARDFVTMKTTLLTKRPTMGFEQAASADRDLLAERNDHTFQLAVDIRRARVEHIRPLASHKTETCQPKRKREAEAAPRITLSGKLSKISLCQSRKQLLGLPICNW